MANTSNTLAGTPILGFDPAINNVLQAFVKTQKNEYFTTQATNGSNGTRVPYENTVISRLDSKGNLISSMELVDAGHGLGIAVDYSTKGNAWIWLTYQGPGDDGVENNLVHLRYKAGKFERDDVARLRVYPEFEEGESIYFFDWENNYLISRYFHFDGSGETYTRRKISEFRRGIDQKYGEMTLPTNPPTMQGFASVGNSFYRWCGVGNVDETTSNDPMKMESYDWNSNELLDDRTYPNLGKDPSGSWPSDKHEPEGVDVFVENDGSASLLFCVVVGTGSGRKFNVYRRSNARQ